MFMPYIITNYFSTYELYGVMDLIVTFSYVYKIDFDNIDLSFPLLFCLPPK